MKIEDPVQAAWAQLKRQERSGVLLFRDMLLMWFVMSFVSFVAGDPTLIAFWANAAASGSAAWALFMTQRHVTELDYHVGDEPVCR